MSDLSRAGFEQLWAQLDARANAMKLSHKAVMDLIELYRALDPADRSVANGVLIGWVSHGTDNQRFDALALIATFKIEGALPALHAERARLMSGVSAPSTPSDLAKVERIIGELQIGKGC